MFERVCEGSFIVTTPEPAALPLMCGGMAVLWSISRRTKYRASTTARIASVDAAEQNGEGILPFRHDQSVDMAGH
jgi:hypothetical protein